MFRKSFLFYFPKSQRYVIVKARDQGIAEWKLISNRCKLGAFAYDDYRIIKKVDVI